MGEGDGEETVELARLAARSHRATRFDPRTREIAAGQSEELVVSSPPRRAHADRAVNYTAPINERVSFHTSYERVVRHLTYIHDRNFHILLAYIVEKREKFFNFVNHIKI